VTASRLAVRVESTLSLVVFSAGVSSRVGTAGNIASRVPGPPATESLSF
jgi:hypothetical protein